MEDEKNVKIVEIYEGVDIDFSIKKRGQEVHVAEKTRSSNPKSCSTAIRKKKCITVKKKEVSEGPNHKKRKDVKKKESSSKRKKKEEKNDASREVRIVVLNS